MSDDRSCNRILAALSHGGRLPWGAQLQRVELSAGQELHAPGVAASHVHFPATALVTLMQPVPGGGEVLVALVGHEGVLGAGALLGVPTESARAVVLHPGAAWRLPVSALTRDGPDAIHLTQVVLTQVQALTTQMSQTALCQRLHSVEQRLCRWLLIAFERVPGDSLAIDLGDLAPLLDLPVDALAGAAVQLVGLGALACEPGRLRLLDRTLLQARACGCHTVIQSSLGM